MTLIVLCSHSQAYFASFLQLPSFSPFLWFTNALLHVPYRTRCFSETGAPSNVTKDIVFQTHDWNNTLYCYNVYCKSNSFFITLRNTVRHAISQNKKLTRGFMPDVSRESLVGNNYSSEITYVLIPNTAQSS